MEDPAPNRLSQIWASDIDAPKLCRTCPAGAVRARGAFFWPNDRIAGDRRVIQPCDYRFVAPSRLADDAAELPFRQVRRVGPDEV